MTSCASRTLPYLCTPTSAAHLASWLFQQSPACRKILFRHAETPRPSERGLFFIRERKCLNLLLSIFFLCEKGNAYKRKTHSELRFETFLITAMPQHRNDTMHQVVRHTRPQTRCLSNNTGLRRLLCNPFPHFPHAQAALRHSLWELALQLFIVAY